MTVYYDRCIMRARPVCVLCITLFSDDVFHYAMFGFEKRRKCDTFLFGGYALKENFQTLILLISLARGVLHSGIRAVRSV